jgi:hypothetical protein
MTWLYVLQRNSLMPLLISVPSTGIKATRQYTIALAGNGLAPYEVVTAIGLERTKNVDGVQFSRPIFRFVEEVPEPMRPTVAGYAEALRAHLKAKATVAETAGTELTEGDLGDLDDDIDDPGVPGEDKEIPF